MSFSGSGQCFDSYWIGWQKAHPIFPQTSRHLSQGFSSGITGEIRRKPNRNWLIQVHLEKSRYKGASGGFCTLSVDSPFASDNPRLRFKPFLSTCAHYVCMYVCRVSFSWAELYMKCCLLMATAGKSLCPSATLFLWQSCSLWCIQTAFSLLVVKRVWGRVKSYVHASSFLCRFLYTVGVVNNSVRAACSDRHVLVIMFVFLQPLLHLSCKDISASEVTTLRRYTNLFIITIIIIFLTLGRYVPEGV